jgi:hypothetical protein
MATATPTASASPTATATASATASATPTPPTGWDYRQKGTLNSSGYCGNLSDYQVRLVLHHGYGTSSGSDVYFNTHCDSNFSDIRFTRADGVTLLNHWLEKGSLQPGVQATFWVEFDNISTTGTEFYVYYSNPNVSLDSDGEATWDFFDDFEGSVINNTKWDALNSPNGTVSNSELTISKTEQHSLIDHGYTTKATFDNCRIVSRGKTSYAQASAFANILSQYIDELCANKVIMYYDEIIFPMQCIALHADKRDCNGSVTTERVNNDFSLNTYYTYYYVRQDADYIRSWEDGVYNGEVTSSVLDADTPVGIFVTFFNNVLKTQDVTVDWIGVGKYCDPEPAWGGWTPDESEPTPTPTATASATPTASASPTATATATSTSTSTPMVTATPTATATATSTCTSTSMATATPTVTPSATPSCVPGDADGDGEINAGDITKLERIILKWDAETPCSDANQDGTVNTSDIGTVEYMILEIWPWNHVYIEAPASLPYCTHFNATVFITYVENFSSASYELAYNASVLDLEGVTGGRLLEIAPGISANFYPANVTDWSLPGGPGTLRVNCSIDGKPGVSGSGYLSQIHFHVNGSAGENSSIGFNVSQCWLRDVGGGLISATWGGASLTVAAVPTPTATCTLGWGTMDSGTIMNLWDIWGTSTDDLFAVGVGEILHYDGTAWSPMGPMGFNNQSYGVWGSASDDVFAVGTHILHYNGTGWSPMFYQDGMYLLDVWGNASDDVFAVDWGGIILHYNGTAWNQTLHACQKNLSSPCSLCSVWGSASDDVFVVGDLGTVLHYNGSTWSYMDSGTIDYLAGVWGDSSGDVYAVGCDRVLRYDGTSWGLMHQFNPNYSLHSIWGNSASDMYIAGTLSNNSFNNSSWCSVILHYDGSNWSDMDIDMPDTIPMNIWGLSGDNVYATGTYGDIRHYSPCPEPWVPPDPMTPYESDREQIKAAVVHFMTMPTDPTYHHTIGDVPITCGTCLDSGAIPPEINGSEIIPNESYCPVAMCPLLTSSFPMGILKGIPASTNASNCVDCGANAELGIDLTCPGSDPGGHYVWYTTPNGSIASVCIGPECTKESHWDGYQGVYP